MDTEDYKKHIGHEYKRLYIESECDEKYMYIVMYGNGGCEGFKEVKTIEDLNISSMMGMRARYNSHRNIGVYAFSCDVEVTPDDITEKLLQNEKVIKVC